MVKTDRLLHERTKEPTYTSGNENEQNAMYDHLCQSCYYHAHMMLQTYPKLRPVILVATGSTYGKEKIRPLFFTGEAIGTFEILKLTF